MYINLIVITYKITINSHANCSDACRDVIFPTLLETRQAYWPIVVAFTFVILSELFDNNYLVESNSSTTPLCVHLICTSLPIE